ncbi:MAG: sulfotransferase [Actinomycetes bacterium]
MSDASAEGSGAEEPSVPLVGFILAGVQKGGTTSLYKMLVQHPQIARASRKELHFFDDDKRDWSNPKYGGYHRHFNRSDSATIAGEATPSYIFWPGSMERIKAYNPDMRLVLSFRDPVERAFSQWSMNKDRRAITPEFAVAIREVRPTSLPRTAQEAGRQSRAFVGRGYYSEQLARVLDLFPAEQVVLLDYHRLFKDLRTSIDRITDLLGIERFAELPVELRQRKQPGSLAAAPPSAEDVAMLVELFADDLAAFARLSGIDVSNWSTSRVAQGSLAASEVAAKLAAKTTFTEVPVSPDVGGTAEPPATVEP